MKQLTPPGLQNVTEGKTGFYGTILCPVASRRLNIVASWGLGWDHVSVAINGRGDRTPTWAEMEWVRDLCFEPTETCMQLSVPREEHINVHPGVLHLWRPQGVEIPRPDAVMV